MNSARKRLRYPIIAVSILAVAAAMAAFFVFGPNRQAISAASGLSNSDVQVNGNPFGRFVHLESESADSLRQLGTASNPALLQSLEDPNKFAAAHQLLTEINPEAFQAASPYWGSDMDPFAMASNDFDEELIPALRDFWGKALAEPQGFAEDERRMEFDYMTTADFELGDFVPCGEESAEFELVISARSHGKSSYQHRQSFCRHKDESTNPAEQPGLTPDHTACALLANGTMTGQLQYSKFSQDSVTVKVEWAVTLDGADEYFRREFEVVPGEDGLVHAGKGNRFEWSFLPSSK